MHSKVYAFMFAVLLVGVALAGGTEKPICQALKCWYDTYNKAYFEGKLPNAEVGYGPCPIENVMSCAYKDHDRFFIRLVVKYNIAPDAAHLNLLHESCHLANWNVEFDDHGPKWQKCMHHLADIGALESLW